MQHYMNRIILGASLITFAVCAHAVDVYKCKGKQGETIFQNAPCPRGDKELAKGEYQRGPDSSNQDAAAPQDQEQQRQAAPPQAQDIGDQRQQPSEQPAAYQCAAGGKTWISPKPCPNTVSSTSTVTKSGPFNGVDQFGNVVYGTGSLTERVKEDHAVQQQGLSHDELCRQLRDQAATSYGEKAGSGDSIYERNKARQQNGC